MSIWSKKEATPHERARIAGTCNCTRDGVQRQPESVNISKGAQMADQSCWIGGAISNHSHGRTCSKRKANTYMAGHRLVAHPLRLENTPRHSFDATCARTANTAINQQEEMICSMDSDWYTATKCLLKHAPQRESKEGLLQEERARNAARPRVGGSRTHARNNFVRHCRLRFRESGRCRVRTSRNYL